MHALAVEGLTKRYGSATALDGVGLEVAAGEVHGLLGPNGAGKTTLLLLLFGLLEADAGSIELLGRRLETTEEPPLEGVAGFVEDPSFYPYLSGRANLELLRELDDRPGSVDDALERVGLTARGEDRVGGYSTGMRQRLGIAAALLREPRLLLLDEPTSGLDPAGARDAARLLRELAEGGTGVLVSSHLIGELEGVCDAYTVLRDGAVVWSGGAAALRTQATESAYALATSDDARALELAAGREGVGLRVGEDGTLELVVEPGRLDAFVLALAERGIAVRRLELRVSPLEHLFFALTS